jgi:hypothetical protein
LRAREGWQNLALAVAVGVSIGLVSGFVENRPDASVIGHRYYGFPLVWRIAKMFLGEEYLFFELFVDCIFWVTVVFVVVFLAKNLLNR